MNEDEPTSAGHYLTKTEAFVVECRARGMSDTAIRRLLQLSASDAAAFGVIPGHASEVTAKQEAPVEVSAATSWPQSEGRRRTFPRRRRSRARSSRRPCLGHGSGRKLSKQEQANHQERNKRRGDNV